MLAIAPSSSPNYYTPTHPSPLSPLSANIYGRPRHMSNTTTKDALSEKSLDQPETQENKQIFKFTSAPNQRTPFSKRPIKCAPTSNPDTIKEKRRSNFLRKVSNQREERRYEARGEDFMRLDFMQRQRAWEAEREREANLEASSQNMPEEEDESELPGWNDVQPKEEEVEFEEFVRDEQAELEAMLENMPQQAQGEDSGTWSDGADYDELFDEIMASQQGQPPNAQADDEMDMS